MTAYGAETAFDFLLVLLGGAVVTAEITLGAFFIGALIGIMLSTARTLTSHWLLRFAVSAYVEVFRGIPALAQLFIIYFGLAYAGLRLEPMSAAITGLGLISGAYMTEIFRAGLQALHHGQREAAMAVGMTPVMAARYILFPQAWRIILPPLANYAIGLLKDTAIVSAIAAPEIMFYARNLVTTTFKTTLIYLLAAGLYLCMSLPLARLADRLEQRRRAWQ
jgi:polar amino acid transport system permease protein